MNESKYNQVFAQFEAMKLEDKAKFLLKAAFDTAFSTFEELSNLMAETYNTVANERHETAEEKFKEAQETPNSEGADEDERFEDVK